MTLLEKLIKESAKKYPDPSIASGFIEGATYLATDLKALALVSEVRALIDAMRYYASKNNYDNMGCLTDGGYTPDGQSEYWPDIGSRATEALTPFTDSEES